MRITIHYDDGHEEILEEDSGFIAVWWLQHSETEQEIKYVSANAIHHERIRTIGVLLDVFADSIERHTETDDEVSVLEQYRATKAVEELLGFSET